MAPQETDATVAELLKTRAAVYGDPTPNLAGTEEIWAVIDKYWVPPPDVGLEAEQLALKAAIKMVAFKIMRITCGKKDHWDNWDDVLGYLKIARNEAEALTNSFTIPKP